LTGILISKDVPRKSTRVARAASIARMAVAPEARVALLDYCVIGYACQPKALNRLCRVPRNDSAGRARAIVLPTKVTVYTRS
jgi:hypothetical protein